MSHARAAPHSAEPRVEHDLRMPVVGAGAWAGGLVGWHTAGATLAATLAVVAIAGTGLAWSTRSQPAPVRRRLAAATLLAAAAVLASTMLRLHAVASSPLPGLAAERAVVSLVGTVTSDPRTVEGAWGDQVVVRVRVHEVTGRGTTYRLRAPVVVLGDPSWRTVTLGEQVRADGRLAPADDDAVAGLLIPARPPVRIRGPDVWWRAAASVRAAVRASVAGRPEAQAALVPALVDGDDAALPTELEQDFRETGLTHLTAVSGTNLTLVVGFLLALARSIGVRGRWLPVVGLLGIAGFVLLARTEPSVVRAAAMGTVGLFALGTDGRRRGLRALGVAVVALLLLDPALAVSAGFALSVLATGGIVVLGPPVQRALERWLPTVLAQAVAVPLAAQLACTPVVASLSGEVSLVAVVANVLVAPAVGPATVLGLAGGLAHLVLPSVGRLLGAGAGWCVAWIAVVAERGASLTSASIGWGTGPLALAVLVVLCAAVAVAAPRALARRWLALPLAGLLVLVLLGVPGRIASWPGRWPPPGWLLVACDVGQGDALVLSTGPAAGVVVDAGPDPRLVDGCLDRLGVREVPLVVLTHFHADHVDGLPGVLRGRRTGTVEVSPVLDPHAGAEAVQQAAAAAGVPVAVAPYGATRRIGRVTLQVLWPDLPEPVPGAGDGSSANDASVVLLAETGGIRLLLTGDVEPPAQGRIAAAVPDLDVDVLKVPHHGSRHQDEQWLASLDPELAVVSAGADNDYGHPDPALLDHLHRLGAAVVRTDLDGDVAVVLSDGAPALLTRD